MNFDFFKTIRKSDRTEALDALIKGSYPRRELFLVTALAAGIAGIGLIGDNIVLIIGSMIIAPLLMPLLGLGLGIAIRNGSVFWASSKTILIGTIVSVLFVIPIALTLDGDLLNVDGSFYQTIAPTLESTLVAVFAGIVSAFAVAKQSLSNSMSGVAISVALVPPLAGTGIAIANLNSEQILATAGQYFLNVSIIALFSAGVFSYLHFEDSLRDARKKFRQEQKEAEKEVKEADQ